MNYGMACMMRELLPPGVWQQARVETLAHSPTVELDRIVDSVIDVAALRRRFADDDAVQWCLNYLEGGDTFTESFAHAIPERMTPAVARPSGRFRAAR